MGQLLKITVIFSIFTSITALAMEDEEACKSAAQETSKFCSTGKLNQAFTDGLGDVPRNYQPANDQMEECAYQVKNCFAYCDGQAKLGGGSAAEILKAFLNPTDENKYAQGCRRQFLSMARSFSNSPNCDESDIKNQQILDQENGGAGAEGVEDFLNKCRTLAEAEDAPPGKPIAKSEFQPIEGNTPGSDPKSIPTERKQKPISEVGKELNRIKDKEKNAENMSGSNPSNNTFSATKGNINLKVNNLNNSIPLGEIPSDTKDSFLKFGNFESLGRKPVSEGVDKSKPFMILAPANNQSKMKKKVIGTKNKKGNQTADSFRDKSPSVFRKQQKLVTATPEKANPYHGLHQQMKRNKFSSGSASSSPRLRTATPSTPAVPKMSKEMILRTAHSDLKNHGRVRKNLGPEVFDLTGQGYYMLRMKRGTLEDGDEIIDNPY